MHCRIWNRTCWHINHDRSGFLLPQDEENDVRVAEFSSSSVVHASKQSRVLHDSSSLMFWITGGSIIIIVCTDIWTALTDPEATPSRQIRWQEAPEAHCHQDPCKAIHNQKYSWYCEPVRHRSTLYMPGRVWLICLLRGDFSRCFKAVKDSTYYIRRYICGGDTPEQLIALNVEH